MKRLYAAAILATFALSSLAQTTAPSTNKADGLQSVGTAPASTAPASQWKTVYTPPSNSKSALRAVTFIDDKTAYACGDNATLLKSTDAGDTWTKLDLPSKANLRAVKFTDADHGFLAGDGDPDSPAAKGHVVFGPGHATTSSTLLLTADAGKTWTKRDLNTNFEITSIATTDGATLLLGNSGGESHMDGDILTLKTDGKGGGTAYRAFRALVAVATLDETHWVAVGSPVYVGFRPEPTDETYTHKKVRALYSDDAGKTFKCSTGSEFGTPLRALAVRKSDSLLIAVGDKGNIITSSDKGVTWKKPESNSDKQLKSVAFGKGDIAIAVGRNGAVLISKDAGKTWSPKDTDKSHTLLGVTAQNDTFLAVTAEGLVVKIPAADLTN